MSRTPRVVVVGSYAVGLVMRTSRIPSPGETVLGHSFQRMDGGKGSNQAVACARLGASTALLAAVGHDADGAAALALHASEGVDTGWVRQVREAPTGVGFITVDDAGHNAISVDLGANRLLSTEDVDAAEELFSSADVVLAQLEIMPETAVRAMRAARRHGARTILNPAPASVLEARDLQYVDILTPNLSEARTMTGLFGAEPTDLALALRGMGVGSVLLTLGDEGVLVADPSAEMLIPAYRVQVVDTTGAGDGFSAALAVALAEGNSLYAAAAFACAVGAYSVQSVGTVPSYPTRSQIAEFLEHHREP